MAAGDPASPTLRRGVTTGKDNPVEIRPFDVQLTCPKLWDPSKERLPITYTIVDRNKRIRRGRLRYVAVVEESAVTLHTQPLQAAELRHGAEQKLPEARCWDGTISSGIRDRVGKRVTADLALIEVYLEAWNTDEDEPGKPAREGERLALDLALVDIDAIAVARWDRNWAVPRFNEKHADHDKGEVSLTIKVRNVRESERVRIEVLRIIDVDDPGSDKPYVDSSKTYAKKQPGLQSLIVRGGKVVRSDDGSKPMVVFNNFNRHWIHPGIDFYAFRVGFGRSGAMIVASERSAPEKKEPERRLQLRFVVFVHSPAWDLPVTRRETRRLHWFFRRRTKYWRSYLIQGGPRSPSDWWQHYGMKFAVLFEGHAAASCNNPGRAAAGSRPKASKHPTYTVFKWKRNKKTKKKVKVKEEYYKKLPRGWGKQRFNPDQNRCPTDVDLKKVGGCGVKGWVAHDLLLGKGPKNVRDKKWHRKKFWLGNKPGRTERNGLNMSVEDDANASGLYRIMYAPRLLFFTHSCRTMITTNLGEHFVQNGTRYFQGWVYSADEDLCVFFTNVFQKWIKGTRANPASSEYDEARFRQVYLAEAKRTRRRRRTCPRLMDKNGVVNKTESATASLGPAKALS